MIRMWRVAWVDSGPSLQIADYPTEAQAAAFCAELQAARGARVGAEIVYWVPVWP